jgi:hypothetical protein
MSASHILVEQLDFIEEQNIGGIIQQSLLFSFNAIPASTIEAPCPICLDDMMERVDELLKLKCPHIYHMNCILEWLENKTSCPVCRMDQSI